MTNQTHSFSIVITSKEHVNSVSINREQDSEVMLEGDLGRLHEVKLIEGILLQITGDNGVLRIDLTEKELVQCLKARK